MRLAGTLVGIVLVVALLVALPALLARRAGRGRGWLALGAYAAGLALAGYALLAAGMCAAATEEPCDAGHGLGLAVAPGAVALAALAVLAALARRPAR